MLAGRVSLLSFAAHVPVLEEEKGSRQSGFLHLEEHFPVDFMRRFYPEDLPDHRLYETKILQHTLEA